MIVGCSWCCYCNSIAAQRRLSAVNWPLCNRQRQRQVATWQATQPTLRHTIASTNNLHSIVLRRDVQQCPARLER